MRLIIKHSIVVTTRMVLQQAFFIPFLIYFMNKLESDDIWGFQRTVELIYLRNYLRDEFFRHNCKKDVIDQIMYVNFFRINDNSQFKKTSANDLSWTVNAT